MLIQTSNAKFFKLNDNKVVFVCGDFSIDLLNPNGHKKTLDFINTMFSINLHPMIIKPSRVTTDSATLIDIIFANEIDREPVGGLHINDISDHPSSRCRH